MKKLFTAVWLACGLALLAGQALAADGRTRRIVEYGNGIKVAVIAEGKGPLLVVLPSGNRDSVELDEFCEVMAKHGYRVIRPQPRGMQGSVGPMEGISLHDFARDVAAAIEAEKAGPAVVIGHAYGAWIARMTSADHPTLVRGVVLAATSAKQAPKAAAEAYLVATNPTKPEADRIKALQYGFFAPGRDVSSWLTGWHPEVVAAYNAAGRATKREEWWHGGTAPMLDLQGELDPWKPREVSNEIKDEFGDRITVDIVPGVSHVMLQEDPVATAKAIDGWIRTVLK